MKSFENLLEIWESLDYPSVGNREAGLKMLAWDKGYSKKAIVAFITRFVRGFSYSINRICLGCKKEFTTNRVICDCGYSVIDFDKLHLFEMENENGNESRK